MRLQVNNSRLRGPQKDVHQAQERLLLYNQLAVYKYIHTIMYEHTYLLIYKQIWLQQMTMGLMSACCCYNYKYTIKIPNNNKSNKSHKNSNNCRYEYEKSNTTTSITTTMENTKSLLNNRQFRVSYTHTNSSIQYICYICTLGQSENFFAGLACW